MPANLFAEKTGIYLLNHSVGLMPSSTRQVVESQFFDAWQYGVPDPWSRWFAVFENFKQALASLFNSEARCFCPQQNISSGIAKYLGCLPDTGQKKVILLSENDFPSIGFVLSQAKKRGYQLRFLSKDCDVQDPQSWIDAMTDDVHSVLVTHVHYNTSKKVPVAEITKAANTRGIFSIVDLAQSAGVVPIDLKQWQADMVVGSCVKWLCGGPGAGFIWLRADNIAKLEPTDVGWFSHKDPFAFDIHQFDYADDACRFWGGTPSVLPYVIATNSIHQSCNIGIEHIRGHNQYMLSKMIDALPTEAVVSPLLSEKRGGTLVVKFEQQEKVEAALKQANVHFDVRPMGMRLSPHIYNQAAEIEQVIACFTCGFS